MPDTTAAGRILIVEDDVLIAMLTEDILTDGDYTVVMSPSVPATLTLLATDRAFDAAVIDVTLHGEESYAIAEALALHCIPFAFATGHDAMSMPPAYRNHPVLSKPYNGVALMAIVKRLASEPPPS